MPCCVAGELELNLKAKKGAYCPGDVIHFSFALDNSTSRDVTEVQVALTQRTVYISSEGISICVCVFYFVSVASKKEKIYRETCY